jgi:hypothetical protein
VQCYSITYGPWHARRPAKGMIPQLPSGVALTAQPDTFWTRRAGRPSRVARFWIAGPQFATGVWQVALRATDSTSAVLHYHWAWGLAYVWPSGLGLVPDRLGDRRHGIVSTFTDDAGAAQDSAVITTRRVTCPRSLRGT